MPRESDWSEFGQRASLHEATVQKVARGEVELPVRRLPRKRRKSAPSWAWSVAPAIWEIVVDLRLDPSHVQIVNEKEVVIWNHPAPWPVAK